jgi:hypothetical protein
MLERFEAILKVFGLVEQNFVWYSMDVLTTMEVLHANYVNPVAVIFGFLGVVLELLNLSRGVVYDDVRYAISDKVAELESTRTVSGTQFGYVEFIHTCFVVDEIIISTADAGFVTRQHLEECCES